MLSKGVKVERAQYDGATRYIDRLLEQRVARAIGGDSTAKRRDLAFDAPLRKALELMEKGSTQKDLFVVAAAQAKASDAKPSAAETAAQAAVRRVP